MKKTDSEAPQKLPLRQRIKAMILVSEISDQQAARSVAIGFASGFLPFPGFQTPFLLPISFLLRLNFPLMYLFNWIANNWLTAAPIVIFTHMIGQYLLGWIGLPQPPVTIELASLNLELFKTIFLPLAVGSVPLIITLPLILYLPALWVVKHLRKHTPLEQQ